MLAGQGGGLFVAHQRRADAGHFVGRHAHTDARGANQQPIIHPARQHRLAHRLGEIGVIAHLGRAGAHVRHRDLVALQMSFERLFEREPGVIAAQGDAALGRVGGCHLALGCLINEIEHGKNALFDLVPAVGVSFVRAADGIADVLLVFIQGFVKFPQQRLLRRLRKQQVDRVHVAVGHAEDIIGPIHQFGGEHAAAQRGDIHAQFLEGAHGVGTGRLALQGADPGGEHAAIRPPTRGVAEQPFGHRAAANVPGANK